MRKPVEKSNEFYDDKVAAKRRDEVVRRMAGTPPDHKTNPRPKKKKPTVSGPAARKGRVQEKS
jgi:hypothetical protein